MDFLKLLRGLFGGDQKPAAPPEQIPASIKRPEPPAFSSFVKAPAQSNKPFYETPLPPVQRQAAPAPARAAQPMRVSPILAGQTEGSDQGPPKRTSALLAGQTNTIAPWNKTGPQQEKEAQKAEKAQSAYFGDAGKYDAQEMSVDAYLTLSPRERAAVDANTALVRAAEEDIASWAKQQVAGKPIDDTDYLNKVKGSFGDKGGSDTYAPRTMAVLEDLGLNLQGKDLDQYLNYSALVTADDLNTLKPGATAGTDPRQQNAVAFSEKASARLSQTLAAGQSLLDGIRTSSDTGRQLFGAPATESPVGFAPQTSERDNDLAQAFDIFAQAQSQQDLTPETVGGVYAELQQKHGVTPNEVAQYFETRLQANEYLNATGGEPVTLGGRDKSLDYLAPADFRSKFLMRGE